MVADAFSRCLFDNNSTKAYPLQAVATMNEIVLTDEQYNTIGQFHNSTAGHAKHSHPHAYSLLVSQNTVTEKIKLHNYETAEIVNLL